MTMLLYTYTDWQAKIVRFLEEALEEKGESLYWIGRQSKFAKPSTIRGVPPGNPFKQISKFESEGTLPLLDDPLGFEKAYLSHYASQMSRYVRGYGSRGHDMQCFHEYRDHFHLTARKFKRLLEKERISSIVFFNMPHTGDDYLLYRVAEDLGLRVTMLMYSLFENCFYSLPSIESLGRINRNNIVEEKCVDLDILNSQLDSNVQSYMAGNNLVERSSFGEWLFALQTLFRKSPTSFLSSLDLPSEFHELIRLRRSWGKSRRASKELRSGRKAQSFLRWVSNLERNKENLPDKYVYFPLHLQPELTTEPQGGDFSDQALAIEMLIERIPDDVEVVVKENPKQGSFNREFTFTDRIRQLERVTVVHPSMSNIVLAENCLAVATIAGTAGWEAIRDCRPCICFGHAWYLDCPGVHKFDSSFDLTHVVSNPPKSTQNEEFISAILNRAHNGTTYEFFLKNSDPIFEKKNFLELAKTIVGLSYGEIETTFR